MARSLAERLQAHEAEKTRLAQKGATLEASKRKARNRKLFETGGLVDKAGLLDLESNALYGALLSLKEGASGKEQVAQWAALGGRAFSREARLRDEGKEPAVLTYPNPLPKDATKALRAAGFRYSIVLQHWEGMAKLDDAEALATTHGGIMRRINAPPAAQPQPGQDGQTEEETPATNGREDLLSRTEA